MLNHVFLAHTWSVITACASVLLTIHVLASRRTPQSVAAWLLALILMPPLGIPLYLFFGTRKVARRARPAARTAADAAAVAAATPGAGGIQHVLAASGLPPPRSASSFELIVDGERAYRELLALIARAQRTIHLSYFIVGDDATGHAVVDALVERARAGVEVRVILDAVGSRPIFRWARRRLRAAGGLVRRFNPLIHRPFRGRSNLRSHRKLAVIDGETLFTGGMNLALEYMGPTPLATRWRDLGALAGGPVVGDLEALFAADWIECGGRAEDLTIIEPPPAAGEAIVQLVASGPDFFDDALYDALLTALFSAKRRIAVVTPYYVPDDALQRGLRLAARRGVRTQLIMPVQSNHALADFARHSSVRDLRAAGVEICGYPKGMVHAKAMIVDDSFAYVGSPNFDVRSLLLNFENALFLYDQASIAQVTTWIDGLCAECTTATFDRRRREWWLMEQVARLLAPEL